MVSSLRPTLRRNPSIKAGEWKSRKRIESLANGKIKISNRFSWRLLPVSFSGRCAPFFHTALFFFSPSLPRPSPPTHYLFRRSPFLVLSLESSLSALLDLNRQTAIGREVGGQFSYTCYAGGGRSAFESVSPRGKIRYGGRMKCHVVPGLNVALRHVIAVRNIITRSRIWTSLRILVRFLRFWRVCVYNAEKCNALCGEMLRNSKSAHSVSDEKREYV